MIRGNRGRTAVQSGDYSACVRFSSRKIESKTTKRRLLDLLFFEGQSVAAVRPNGANGVSGFDRMYEVLLSQGRPAPELREGPDRVEVVIRRRIINPQVVDLIAKADASFQLTQRERICLGMLAQHDALTARELAGMLELQDVDALRPWLGRLQDVGLVGGGSGRTRAMRYFIEPQVLKGMGFPAKTTLRRISPHRLDALLIEDLTRYPGSAIGAIQERVGAEVPRSQVKRALDRLIAGGQVRSEGDRRWRRYWVV